MTYILVIWTIVAVQGTGTGNYNMVKDRDWRPIGEFYNSPDSGKNARQMCEDAARELGRAAGTYRCIRSR
jgi:hypothetical protein